MTIQSSRRKRRQSWESGTSDGSRPNKTPRASIDEPLQPPTTTTVASTKTSKTSSSFSNVHSGDLKMRINVSQSKQKKSSSNSNSGDHHHRGQQNSSSSSASLAVPSSVASSVAAKVVRKSTNNATLAQRPSISSVSFISFFFFKIKKDMLLFFRIFLIWFVVYHNCIVIHLFVYKFYRALTMKANVVLPLSYPKIKCGNGLTKAKRGPKAGPITKSSKERKKNYPREIQLFFYPLIALINLTSEDWSICGKLHLGPKMWLFAGIIIWQKLIVCKILIEKI